MPDTKAANHLAGQLLRSGTSPALNYGEAQSGESRKDFILKIKIALKELRETNICLKIIYRTQLFKNENKIKIVLNENNELISIFVKSVETALKNTKIKKEKNQE
jgi:four helix bundle protein